MDDRRLTLIVVPHGDLETRTFEIPYRKLRIGLYIGVGLLLLIGFVVATWIPILAQAGRVPALLSELKRLEAEREQVAELAKTLAEVEAQYERVRTLLGAEGGGSDDPATLPPLRKDSTPANRRATGGSDAVSEWPLASEGLVTRHSRSSGNRSGVDIRVPTNSLVRAAGRGTVKDAGTDPVFGEYVLLAHSDGLESFYGHASRVLVKVGEPVARGEVIALTGASGKTEGPGLHFEIRKNGEAVDPMLYVKQK